MTTVAADAREGVMCSDSFWFDEDQCGIVKKVWRIRGGLVGVAGNLDESKVWLDALRANKTLPKKDLTVLRLTPSGIECWTAVDGWHRIDQRQFAIGTGGKAARAAMAAGATCRQAVRIVCDIDANTGGRVRSYRLRSAP